MCNKIIAPAAGPGILFTARIFLFFSIFVSLFKETSAKCSFVMTIGRHDEQTFRHNSFSHLSCATDKNLTKILLRCQFIFSLCISTKFITHSSVLPNLLCRARNTHRPPAICRHAPLTGRDAPFKIKPFTATIFC